MKSSKVKTGDWGIPLPWYFCLTRDFWLGSSSKSQTSILTDTSTSSDKSILVQPIQKSWKKTEAFKVKDVVKQFTVKGRAPRIGHLCTVLRLNSQRVFDRRNQASC